MQSIYLYTSRIFAGVLTDLQFFLQRIIIMKIFGKIADWGKLGDDVSIKWKNKIKYQYKQRNKF